MKAVKSNHYHNPAAAKKRLLYWLLIFLVGISLPVYFLLHKVYSQLENETWYRQRSQAELLVERIERQLLEKLQPEQDRPIAEYSFFNVLENPLLKSATVNLSPLSELPPKSDIPSLVGYFQIDPNGRFHIPALPELNINAKSGLSAKALATRNALKEKLRGLLALNGSEQEVVNSEVEGKKDLKEDNDASQQSQMQTNRFDDYFQSDERDQAAGIGRLEAKTQAKKKSSTAAAKKKSKH